jgi:hypothetical protein
VTVFVTPADAATGPTATLDLGTPAVDGTAERDILLVRIGADRVTLDIGLDGTVEAEFPRPRLRRRIMRQFQSLGRTLYPDDPHVVGGRWAPAASGGGLELVSAGHDRGVAHDRDRWYIWAIPIAIVVGGVALRFTERLWLVDLLDVPGLSETGNVALGFVVGAGWYVFPLIVGLVRRLSGRRSPRTTWGATVVLSIFAALGAVAIAAFPDRYGGAYNEALDDQMPGFSALRI